MLISPKTNEQLNLITQKMFHLNRILDRAVSVMSVNFSCVKSSKIIHLKFSHKFPLLADQITDIQDNFNELSDYLETPTDITLYQSLLEIFQRVLDNVLEANDLIRGAIEVAQEEGDYNVESSLKEFLSTTFIHYINQSIILRDKAKLYGEDVLRFDKDIETFFILDN